TSSASVRTAGEVRAGWAGGGWWLWIEMLAAARAGGAADTRAPSSPPSMGNWPARWPWLTCGAAGVGWAPVAAMWWVRPGWMFWTPCADGCARPRAAYYGWPAPVPPAAAPVGGGLPPDAIFARYRSAGGHATAQLIVPTIEALADVTATAALSPVSTMLAVCRAALGASS